MLGKAKVVLLAIIAVLLVAIFLMMPKAHECGACGAMTYDVYYTQNIHTGEQVEICQTCANAINE